ARQGTRVLTRPTAVSDPRRPPSFRRDGCSAGPFRTCQCHNRPSAAVTAAADQKEARPPKPRIIQEKKTGEAAPPNPAPAATRPQTRARFANGNQSAFIRAHEG